MRKVLSDIARHLIVHMYSFRTSFDILSLFAKLRARKLSGAAVPYPSGTYFRRYSEKAATARLAQFILGLALCRGCCEFDFGPKVRVQFSCLQSRPCLPMTWRCDAGIFSINNARDPKLPKRRRSGTRRTIRINRSFDRCLVRFTKKRTFVCSLPNFCRLIQSIFMTCLYYIFL